MAFNLKTGGGTANADTPGSFSNKDTNTLTKLAQAKAAAAKLQAKKSADSLQFEKDYEKMLGRTANPYSVGKDALEKIKKRAQEVTKDVYDFDVIKPTEKFPKTGVAVKKGTYLGSGFITDDQEQGFGKGMTVSELAKDQPRGGFEQTKAKKIREILGLK